MKEKKRVGWLEKKVKVRHLLSLFIYALSFYVFFRFYKMLDIIVTGTSSDEWTSKLTFLMIVMSSSMIFWVYYLMNIAKVVGGWSE